MLSPTDICNAALVKLGASTITSLDDPSDRARSAKATYFINRDSLLRQFPWNFARKQMALNTLATAPVVMDMIPNSDGPGSILYTLAFAAPTDMVRLFRWSPQYTHWRLVSGTPFGFNGLAVITDAIPAPSVTANSINSTQPLGGDGADNLPPSVSFIPALTQVGCEYIARVEDPNLWDELFGNLMVLHTALDLAYTTTGSEGMIDRIRAELKEAQNDASAVNGMENWPDQIYDTTVANVRFGYSGFWYNP